MSKVCVAAIQMACVSSNDNEQAEKLQSWEIPGGRNSDAVLNRAEELVRLAAGQGAQVILLPELFERRYFCQERQYAYYEFAKSVEESPAVQLGKKLAKELNVVLPISFYEKAGNVLYNSVAFVDAGGELQGVYRKIHIPDDHFYQEKFYFTPGDTGFRVFHSKYGNIGIGICWDQWFPETARALALLGAEMILYPTAIGSEPILNCDSMPHWRRCMMGHAASNIIPVVTANRIGTEKVYPTKDNGFQQSSLKFYGSSFLADETGKIVASASRDEEEVLLYSYDLEEIAKNRLSWGLFRDRRPKCYTQITGETDEYV